MTPAQAFEKEKERERRIKDEEKIQALRHELRMAESQIDVLKELNWLMGKKIKELKQAREVL